MSKGAKGCLTTALLVVWQSPDLAVKDRRRVAEAIKAELEEVAGKPHGAIPEEVLSLGQIMEKYGKLVGEGEPELTLAEISS